MSFSKFLNMFLRNTGRLYRLSIGVAFPVFLAVCGILADTANCTGQQAVAVKDTFSIYFPLDVHLILPASRKTLDSLVYRDVITPDKELYVIGYADYVGRSTYNDTLSLQRAMAVKKYLLSAGFTDERIRLVTGRGEVRGRDSSGRGGWPVDRRVDIAIARKGFAEAPASKKKDTILHTPAMSLLSAGQPKIVASAPSLPIERLADLPVDKTIVLRNLYFPHGRHYVYSSSYPALDALVNTLQNNATLRVRVEGHVCCIDPAIVRDALDEDTGEIALSVNRAKYIVEYLVSKGIMRDRLEYLGFGKSRPVVLPERSQMDTEANRRVEIRVLSR